jgi:DNA-binding CsgD family transcriptional regulator
VIARLIGRARVGHSGALLVAGDAGTGKTALLDDAVQQSAGMRVLSGTCVESEAELAFSGLHLLLRPAVDRLDVLPGPQAAALRAAFGLADAAGADRFLAGLATLTLLSELADGEPLLCVYDDAHWLDQASATALVFAARRLDTEGIALVIATRGGGLLSDASGIPAITLGPLDQGAATRLLAEHAADLVAPVRDRIIEVSQGNPLALIELPAAMTAEQRAGEMDPHGFHVGALPVPGRVQSAFASQITGLPEPSQLLLAVAAADDTGDLGIIVRAAAVLGASLADLAPAERARLVELNGQRVLFRHPLVRTAAYQSATSSLRIAVHRALAEVLAVTGHPDREAWHLAAGATGPDEMTAAKLERTADSARERGGYAAEAAAYERAAQLSADREAKGRRLARAAEATLASGHLRSAGAMAARAMPMISDPLDLARLAELRANFEFETGSTRTAGRLLLEGASAAALAPDLAVRMLSSAVHYANVAGDRDLAMRAAGQLAVLAVPPGLEALVPAITGLAHMSADQLGRGVREIIAVLRQLSGAADRYPPVMSRSVIGFALLAGDDQIALDSAVALAARCRAQGMISMLPFTLTMLAEAQLFLGKLDDARGTGAEAMRIAADTGQGHRIGHLNGVLARIAAIQGDEQGCAELASRAVVEDSGPAAWAGTSLSLLDLTLGRYDAAISRLTGLSTGPARNTLAVTFALPDLVEAAAGAQRQQPALAALARFEEFSSAAGQPWAEATALRCHALLGHDPGESFEQAVRLHAAGTRPFERARTELAYGRWLRRAKRRLDARAQLESALTIFSQLGAAAWAGQARDELRAAGATTVAQAGGAGLAARLTAQELQVVRRAAAGLSNREIAAELFLSPRTVGYHLYKAYPKLNITTRRQLANLSLPGH